MIASHAASDVIVERDTLPEVQQYRSRGIRSADSFEVGDNLVRQDWRPVTLPIAERLRVIGLIAVHPADDEGIVAMTQADFILVADQTHAGLFQCRQLLFGRAAPETDVGVEAGLAIPFRVGGSLEPHCERKESAIGGRTFGPFFVGVAGACAALGRRRGEERENDCRQQPPDPEHRTESRSAGRDHPQDRLKKTSQRCVFHGVLQFSVCEKVVEQSQTFSC